MRKYLIQILVVLLMLVIAWGLYTLSSEVPTGTKEDVDVKASIKQPIIRLPISSEFYPIRNWSIKELEITAKSAIVVNFNHDNKEESILYKKNIHEVLPFASLTKIMTGIIVLENFDLEQVITVSKNSVLTEGDNGGLINGEELKVKDLLYIMLIESSNDATMALTNDNVSLSYDEFVNLMNDKAAELGLENTTFIDPIGLNSKNKSTVFELAKLTNYALNFPILWEILKIQETTIYSIDNQFIHNLTNTNKLLEKISLLKGGKTGYTEEAGECMLTVSDVNSSFGDNYLITVVLNSNQREIDTETLINWVKQAYIW